MTSKKEVKTEKPVTIKKADKFSNVSTVEQPSAEKQANIDERDRENFNSDSNYILKGEFDKEGDPGIGKEERIEILKKFTKNLLEKHGALIRSVVLFGSTAREEWRGESDIDVFVIVDDTRQRISPEMLAKIDKDVVEIARGLSKQLSIQQPYLLTEFWAMVREGHPIIFNFIREGVPVYDKDIFLPIKRLLQMGEIRPSKEAVEKYIDRAPKRIFKAEDNKIYSVVEDLYYAMLESVQAVLMFLGKSPPRPSDAANEMRRSLVQAKLLEEKYAEWMAEIIEIRKEVEHKRINEISGADVDKWIERAKDFTKKMQSLIVKIEVLKRENMIDKSYAIMMETIVTLLKSLGKLPASNDKLVEAFENEVIKKGLVSDKYMQVFLELQKMVKSVDEGKVIDVDKRNILQQREMVRKFIRDVGVVLKKNLVAPDNGE